MAAPSDAYIVSTADRTVKRKCPFCQTEVEDFKGDDVNFIVHIGRPILEHRVREDWAKFVVQMNSG
jgi:hypothetical protein